MLDLRCTQDIHAQIKKLQVQGCPILQRDVPKITMEESQKGTSSGVQGDGADEHRGRDERRGGGGGGGGRGG